MDCRQTITGDLFHLELVLKVCLRRDMTGSFVSSPTRGSVRSRRKRTLLSFQRPSLLTAQKSLRLAPEAQGSSETFVVSDCVLRALQCRGTGTCPTPPLSDSRGMVASLSPQSSAGKPHESPLSSLDEGPLEPAPRDIDLHRRLPVDLDPALGDQPPRLARRADAELFDQEGR
jgi:hypothetical protein